jgi:beta-lactamase regulating signal transducer with metallopeptidase domain
VQVLLVAYLAGVVIALGRTVTASLAVHRIARRARVLTDDGWARLVADGQRALRMRCPVRLFITSDVSVPMTWGIVRPVVLLPAMAARWTGTQRAIVLRHELAHVRAGDWLFALAARVAGALYWFHPGVWWISRRMHDDCELTCDGRVIAAGVRRSDYVELLLDVAASQAGSPPLVSRSSGVALARRRGLRARVAAMLDPSRSVRPLARRWIAVAAGATLVVAGPTSVVRLAPTRAVLATLMRDARWESRAYAVLGLAQRADSIAVAQTAAAFDPNPRVRAWARYALGEAGETASAVEPPAPLQH